MRIGLVLITNAAERGTGGSGTRSHEISFSKALDFAAETGDTVVRFFPAKQHKKRLFTSSWRTPAGADLHYRLNFWDRIYQYRNRHSTISRFIRRHRLLGLDRLLQLHEIDIAIFASPNPALLCLERTPFVSTVWDLGHRQLPHFKEMYGSGGQWHEREFYFQIALNRGVATFTDSESTSQNLVTNYGLDHAKARAIGLAVEKLEPAQLTNIPEATKHKVRPNGLFFYYPANWWSHKNHLVLIKAMKLLMEETSEVTLVFSGNPNVGTEGYRERMLLLTEHLQLSQHVFFLESVDDATNSWLLQNCAGLCMPSLLGPTNIPPLEALAYSKPVAVSNAHAKEGPLQKAIFLDPRTPEDWSQFMKSVIKNVQPVDTGQSAQKLNDRQIRDLLNQLRYDLALMRQ